MTDASLARFVEAQEPVRARVTAELDAARKSTHWMWFVFPQIAGLGRSQTAQRYAIQDLEEARRYLAHPLLGSRLRQDVHRLLAHEGLSAREILGSPDDMKLRSCLTLFREAAGAAADRDLFQRGLDRFYDGKADELTLSLLRPGTESR